MQSATWTVVRSITTNISDADSPNAESIVSAAAPRHHALLVGHTDTNRTSQSFDQLDALKPRVAKIAALSEKYRMTVVPHLLMPNTSARSCGSAYLLRNHDPSSWVPLRHRSRVASPERDVRVEPSQRRAVRRRDGVQDCARAESRLRGQGGRTGPPGAVGGRGDGPPPGAGAVRVGRVAGRRRRRRVRIRSWRRSRRAAGPGRGGRGPMVRRVICGWKRLAHAIGPARRRPRQPGAGRSGVERNCFTGPAEIQAEYPNGGARMRRTRSALPREQVLGAMKRSPDPAPRAGHGGLYCGCGDRGNGVDRDAGSTAVAPC